MFKLTKASEDADVVRTEFNVAGLAIGLALYQCEEILYIIFNNIYAIITIILVISNYKHKYTEEM